MGAFGLGRGIAKMVRGAVTGDVEELLGGVRKTAVNTITTIDIFSGTFGDNAGKDSEEDY